MEKWERREKKYNRKKMKVSGKGTRLLQKIIVEKSKRILEEEEKNERLVDCG